MRKRKTLKQQRAQDARERAAYQREESREARIRKETRDEIQKNHDLELLSQFCDLIDGVQLPDDVFLTAGRMIANQACFSQFNVGLLRRLRDSIRRLGKS